MYRLVRKCETPREGAGMRTTLTIDDDVAEILEKQSREENKPFEQVVNDALRRGTSARSGDGGEPSQKKPFRVKAHDGRWMAGDDPARLKEMDNALSRDEEDIPSGTLFDRQSFESVVARRKELFSGQPLSGDSVELIREAREIRDAQIENWA